LEVVNPIARHLPFDEWVQAVYVESGIAFLAEQSLVRILPGEAILAPKAVRAVPFVFPHADVSLLLREALLMVEAMALLALKVLKSMEQVVARCAF